VEFVWDPSILVVITELMVQIIVVAEGLLLLEPVWEWEWDEEGSGVLVIDIDEVTVPGGSCVPGRVTCIVVGTTSVAVAVVACPGSVVTTVTSRVIVTTL
jgi:hypothetical protein